MKRIAFFSAFFLLASFLQGCVYSKDYFRIDPETGKKIKASGPITPEELTGDPSEMSPPEVATGGTTGGSTTSGGTTTGGAATGGTTTGGEDETIVPGEANRESENDDPTGK